MEDIVKKLEEETKQKNFNVFQQIKSGTGENEEEHGAPGSGDDLIRFDLEELGDEELPGEVIEEDIELDVELDDALLDEVNALLEEEAAAVTGDE